MEKDGVIIERRCGTPQGGVVSPILSNLFLHYCLDGASFFREGQASDLARLCGWRGVKM
jgi:hypothetical protein